MIRKTKKKRRRSAARSPKIEVFNEWLNESVNDEEMKKGSGKWMMDVIESEYRKNKCFLAGDDRAFELDD